MWPISDEIGLEFSVQLADERHLTAAILIDLSHSRHIVEIIGAPDPVVLLPVELNQVDSSERREGRHQMNPHPLTPPTSSPPGLRNSNYCVAVD